MFLLLSAGDGTQGLIHSKLVCDHISSSMPLKMCLFLESKNPPVSRNQASGN